jgi:carboxylesterase type B
MHSNGPGVQPKSLSETQRQFDELLSILEIPLSLPASQKLSLLRSKSSKDLVIAISKMRVHQFRAVTDGVFIKPSLFPSIQNGAFAKNLLASNIKIMIGDCASEHHMYALHRPPTLPSSQNLYKRFLADYPKAICRALGEHYSPDGGLPKGCKTWKEAFGKIYADVQIHATQRGFIDALYRHGAQGLVHRYRIDWRSETVRTPKKFGATHGADMAIWFFGDGKVLPESERVAVKEGFIDHLARFVNGERLVGWEGMKADEARRLKVDGTIDTWRDSKWEEGLKVWKAIIDAGAQGELGEEKPKL